MTDEFSIAAAVTAATDKFVRIDLLLNNAGHGIVGAVEEIGDSDARRVTLECEGHEDLVDE